MKYLDIHTHKSTQEPDGICIQSLSLSNDIFLAMPKKKPISVGIHPWYARLEDLALQLKYLSVLAAQPNVKLIGECGLDKGRGESMDNQLLILEAQISLAQSLGKPVILHCVKAFDELIALKKKINPTVPLIIHGFNKKYEMANQLINHGFYLSFGAAVLNSAEVARTLEKLDTPFFLETDQSAVSIKALYEKVAEIKKMSLNELKDIIFANWKKLNSKND